MDQQSRQYTLRQTFDDASAGYDRPALRFFLHAAEHLADSMALTGNEHILDVACGTGTVSLACAERLGSGRVTGVGLSVGAGIWLDVPVLVSVGRKPQSA